MTTVVATPLALPRSATLTDRLIAPADRSLTDGDRQALRDELRRQLAAHPGKPRERIRVDGRLVHAVNRGRLPTGGRFEWSVGPAGRFVGLAALRACAHDPHLAPAHAVAHALRDAVQSAPRRPQALGRWLSTLPEGGRAAVHAEALRWTVTVQRALDWERIGMAADVGGADRWWDCALSGVGVRARAEVRVPITTASPAFGGRVDEGPSPDHHVPTALALFSVLPGWPGPSSRIELGITALAHILTPALRLPPARIVGWWPETGRATVLPVDRALLDHTIGTLVRTVDALRVG